jgi:filamentous hemagglutinin family protein
MKTNQAPAPLLRRKFLPLMIAACFTAVEAAPTAPVVVNGQATFLQQGNVFSITNTPGTIINWQSFSVNEGEITRFIQQNSDSAVLNRILGQDPSRIMGALQSNGRVFLINPNGILFGKDSRVDVGGLVASSLNMSNADFLAGKNNFSGGNGSVSNQGSITTATGGHVFLIAPNVDNTGIITSPKGEVILAAGHTVHLVDSSNPSLQVVVSAPENAALNLGQVIAQGGRIGIYGALINNKGKLNANSAVVGENGKILLKASRDTMLEAGSVVTATGAGKGGDIQVLGNRVALTGDALVDASGQTGGGTVLVGGDFQGKNTSIPNAQQSYVGSDAVIKADAVASGDGGTIVAWADNTTQFHGTASARGGAVNGSGGLVETSGKNLLDIAGANILASGRGTGANGRWLLDPSDITISHGVLETIVGGIFNPLVATSTIGDSVINAVLDGGTNVTIRTSSGSGGAGSITVNGNGDSGGAVAILNSSGGSRSLTLETAGTIAVHSGATIGGSTSNALNVNLTGATITQSGIIDNKGGSTVLDGATTMSSGTIKNGTLSSTGTLNGATLDGVTVSGTLNTTGNICVDNNLALASGAVVNLTGNSMYFMGSGTEGLTTAGTATVNLANGNLLAGYGGAQTLTIGNGVTVQGYGNVTHYSSSTIVNDGTIAANGAGQTLAVNPNVLTNNGSLNATAGNLNLSPATWGNSGSVNVAAGATLNLAVSTTVAGLGTLTNAAGTVNYSGTLTNTSGTVNVGTGGAFGAAGLTGFSGSIVGGTVTSTGGNLPNGSGTYNGVTMSGTLAATSNIFFDNNLVLAGGSVLNMGNHGMYFMGSGSESLTTSGSATVNLANGSLYAGYGGTQTLTIGSGVTVQGYGNVTHHSTSTIVNDGTITSSGAGQTMTVNPNTFTNNGSLNATAGNLNLSPTTWTNPGAVTVASGATLNLGFSTTVAGLGTLTNSAGTPSTSAPAGRSAQPAWRAFPVRSSAVPSPAPAATCPTVAAPTTA